MGWEQNHDEKQKERILKVLKVSPLDLTKAEIARRANMRRNTVVPHLHALVE